MKNNYLKLIKLLLIVFSIFLFLFLINKNFPRSGQITVEMKLGKDLPAITKLGPEPRVILQNGFQSVLEGPVYFDLRSMPWFKEAIVIIVFLEEEMELEGIAGQSGPGWQYDIKEPFLVNDLEQGLKIALFNFDLDELYQQKNIRRFLISLKPSGQRERPELKIYSLKIILNQ